MGTSYKFHAFQRHKEALARYNCEHLFHWHKCKFCKFLGPPHLTIMGDTLPHSGYRQPSGDFQQNRQFRQNRQPPRGHFWHPIQIARAWRFFAIFAIACISGHECFSAARK